MRHQQFFKATYWVTTIIDYINGVPLEKESNYILVQTAKCRLISNLLGSPLVLFLRSGRELWVRRVKSLRRSWKHEKALPFHSTNWHQVPCLVRQLCSRHWSCRCEQDRVSFLMATPRPQNPKCSWTHLSNYRDSFSEHLLGLGTCNPGAVNLLALKAEIFRGGKGLRGSWWED